MMLNVGSASADFLPVDVVEDLPPLRDLLRLRPALGGLAGRVLHHVGDEALVARDVLAGQHDGLPHRGVLGQAGLDLSQLDAEAADLDLVVDAAEESRAIPSRSRRPRSPVR